MIHDINSEAHALHTKGFIRALKDRQETYPKYVDPKPFMRRTSDPLTGQPLHNTPLQKLMAMPCTTATQLVAFRKKALKVVAQLSP